MFSNKSKNPLLRDDRFNKMSTAEQELSEVDGRVIGRGSAMDAMTVDGAVNKTLMLFGLMMVTTVLADAQHLLNVDRCDRRSSITDRQLYEANAGTDYGTRLCTVRRIIYRVYFSRI